MCMYVHFWRVALVRVCVSVCACEESELHPERWSDNSRIQIKHGEKNSPIKLAMGWSRQHILNLEIVLHIFHRILP